MSEVCWDLARQGDQDQIDLIVHKYYKVGYKIAHKWARSGQIEESEAVGLANIAIMKCIKKGTFDETRGIKFTSYLGTAVHNEIRMFLRKERRIRDRNCFSLDQPLTADRNSNGRNGHFVENLTYADIMVDPITVESQLEDQFLIEDALQVLDSIIEELTDLELRCLSLSLSGLTIKELSNELNYSPNYVRKVLNVVQDKLKEKREFRDSQQEGGH